MNIKEILDLMIKEGGSDLHLRAGCPPAIRIDGEITMVGDTKLFPKDVEQLALTIMTPSQREAFKNLNEIDFAFGVSGLGRFRTNIYRQRGTISINLRAIPVKIHTFEELHLPDSLKIIAEKSRGLILVTGVTGSGKSTTLAAMINHVNTTMYKNIITIEDPIEFLHQTKKSIISQREIGTDTSSFNTALKYVLRQDPDIILIGEIRDEETVRTALQAADTGHLVFSTLHTTDAPETVNRVISFFPPHHHQQIRSLLAANLEAVISQRLLPISGDKGRVPALEILVGSATVKEYILDHTKTNQLHDIMKAGKETWGMQTFDQAILDLYSTGMIAYETGLEFSTNPSEFALRIKGIES